MHGLLPLLIALALVESAKRVETAPYGSMAMLMGGSLVAWLILAELLSRLAGGRGRRVLDLWDNAGQVLMLGWFAWICLGLGWSGISHAYTLLLAPWVVANAIHWWTMAGAWRRLGAPWTRIGWVRHHLRFGLLPVAALLPVMDVCDVVGRHLSIDRWIVDHLGPAWNVAGSFALAIGLIVALPWILVRLWGARPLQDPEAAQLLRAGCQASGVGVTAVLAWPVEGGRSYNAMVLGLLPRLRYVLFTEDLVRDFSPDQQLAVLGHELGHARHGHLWLYLLFASVAGMATWLAKGPIIAWILTQPLPTIIGAGVVEAVVTVALLAVAWRLVFGWLSRACERQADLAGAQLAGDAHAMQEALRAVGRHGGQDEDTPSWRHHSLGQRIAFLARTVADPTLVVRHHAEVRRIWWLMSVAAAALALTIVLLQPRLW